MIRALTIALTAGSLAVAGCGSASKHAAGGSTPNPAPVPAGNAGAPVAGPGSAPPAGSGSASVVAHTAPGYGKLLVDGAGRTLYLFTHDQAAQSRCSGACAKAWPPVIVAATPGAGTGVQGAALGVTRRADNTLQATYHGHPLYYFLGDAKPGQINCQDVEEFGGHWWLLKPNGSENRATP